MQDQLSTADPDRLVLAALGVREGCASPGELREATGLPARTLTRALGRLDAAGLLAERSKGIVRLSASAWRQLPPASRPGADLDGQERHQAPAPVIRARARSGERPRTAPARDHGHHDQDVLEDPGELDVDEDAYEDVEGRVEPKPGGGFIDGLLKGLSTD